MSKGYRFYSSNTRTEKLRLKYLFTCLNVILFFYLAVYYVEMPVLEKRQELLLQEELLEREEQIKLLEIKEQSETEKRNQLYLNQIFQRVGLPKIFLSEFVAIIPDATVLHSISCENQAYKVNGYAATLDAVAILYDALLHHERITNIVLEPILRQSQAIGYSFSFSFGYNELSMTQNYRDDY